MDSGAHDKILRHPRRRKRNDACDCALRRFSARDNGELRARRRDALFGTAADSQKARNIALNDKVSLTINLPYDRTEEILGLSMGARAHRVIDAAEIAHVGDLMLRRFPEGADFGPDEGDSIAIFAIKPVVISVLDYRNGIGHTELVTI